MRYSQKWPVYAKQWDRMTINKDRLREFDHIARYIIDHKEIYLDIEKRTGVPWHMVAVLHQRESSGRFDRYLGNGEPLNRVTRLVPRGRGPFLGPHAFVDGAIDALAIDGLSKIIDWRLEKELYFSESFNGWGYAARGLPSPYIFGGTNIQRPGKYIADGKFDSHAMDSQPGVAPMLWMIAKLDPTVVFVRES